MEPREYAAAVWHRCVWVGAAGLATATAAIAVGLASPPTYTATSSLYVGVVEVDAPQDLAWASLLQDDVLPTIVRLATSPAVLEPVVDELSLDRTAAQLAGSIDVALGDDTSVLVVSARAGSAAAAAELADAVAENLSAVATTAHAGGDGTSSLRVAVVGPAREPMFRSAPDLGTVAVRGLALGLGIGVVLSGLAELARPRLRGASGAAALTDLPILAGLPTRGGRGSPGTSRSAGIDRLAWLLRSSPTLSGARRLLLLGTAPQVARGLAEDLQQVTGTDLPVTPVMATELTGMRPGTHDRLVVVTTGRTTRHSLTQALATAEESGVPVAGLVVEGVLTPAAGLRERFRAALRGDAPLPQRPAGTPRLAGAGLPWMTSARITAVSALFAVGLSLPLPASTSSALVAGLLLLPVWISAVPRFTGGVLLCGLAGLALLFGLLLAGWSSTERDFGARAATETTILLLTGLGAIGLLLWARGVLPVPAIGVAYGLGLLVHGVLHSAESVNAFKFELSLPITIIVLSLAGAARRGRLVTVVALAVVGAANVFNDARSAFGFCVIAAGLVVWQLRPASRGRRSNAWAGMLMLAAAAVGVYLAATELMVSGALGAEVQARTTTQIAQSGSLLLGGRPEWTATWALMQDRPLGYGLGIAPDGHDLAVAKTGMSVTNIPTIGGYLEHFMLTDRFELHSVAADLWSALGPAGLAYAVALGVLLVASFAQLLAGRRADGLACFLGLTALWNVAFGTLPSNGLAVAVAVGLMLLPRTPVAVPTGGPSAVAGPATAPPVRAVPVAAAAVTP